MSEPGRAARAARVGKAKRARRASRARGDDYVNSVSTPTDVFAS